MMPPPMLPHPAAKALADPTMRVVNMLVHQNWHATKVASENPIKRRLMINPAAPMERPMQNTAGAVMPMHRAMP